MKSAAVITIALLLVACSQADEDASVPSDADVARAEARMAGHPCVGDISGWERNYRFPMRRRLFWPQSDHPDFDEIEFHFRRVGSLAIRPARNIIPAGEDGDWPDSSPIRTLDGSFSIKSGLLRLEKCTRV